MSWDGNLTYFTEVNWIIKLIFGFSSGKTSTRPSLRPSIKPAVPGVLPDISPRRYVVYTTGNTIRRVNLDNPEDTVESSRPEPGNLHVDTKTMMIYYSTFDGEKIMKQPFNFAESGFWFWFSHQWFFRQFSSKFIWILIFVQLKNAFKYQEVQYWWLTGWMKSLVSHTTPRTRVYTG